jgi:hypothetical protein
MKGRFQGVIFDLFGTLVEDFSHSEYQGIWAEMAAAGRLCRRSTLRNC